MNSKKRRNTLETFVPITSKSSASGAELGAGRAVCVFLRTGFCFFGWCRKGARHSRTVPSNHGRRNFKDTNPFVFIGHFIWGGEAVL